MTTAREIASRFWLDTFSKADLERAIIAAIEDEREACARLASGMSDGADCDERGSMDMGTGEVSCGAESRGDVCVCAERSVVAFKIAGKIRARSA